MFCENCGKEVQDNWEICPNCGKPVDVLDLKAGKTLSPNQMPSGKTRENHVQPVKKKRKWSWIAGGAAALLLVIAVAAIIVFGKKSTEPSKEKEMVLNTPAPTKDVKPATQTPLESSAPKQTETVNAEAAAAFVGTWSENMGIRCHISITCDDGVHFRIEINASDGASYNTCWTLEGIYDEEQGGIAYTGSETEQAWDENGVEHDTRIYEDGTGLLYFKQDGLLYWRDDKKNAGAGYAFQSDRILSAEENKDWYLMYERFFCENNPNGMRLEISCQNDAYLDVSFQNGLQIYDSDSVDVEPDAIGNEGELIYEGNWLTLTFYPYDQHINIYTTAGVYKGNYYPAEETTASDFILPRSDSMYYTETDLAGLTAKQCRIARNEIYARHGRIFQSEDLQNYFEQFAWYEGKYTAEQFSESVFNQYEKANIQLIKDYEAKKGY